MRTAGAGEGQDLHWPCKLEEDEGEKRDWVRLVLAGLLSGTRDHMVGIKDGWIGLGETGLGL